MELQISSIFSFIPSIDPSSNNVNFNYSNGVKQFFSHTLFFNFSPMIEMYLPTMSMVSASWKGKEKVYNQATAIPCGDPTLGIISKPKKKKFKRYEWEVNKVYHIVVVFYILLKFDCKVVSMFWVSIVLSYTACSWNFLRNNFILGRKGFRCSYFLACVSCKFVVFVNNMLRDLW